MGYGVIQPATRDPGARPSGKHARKQRRKTNPRGVRKNCYEAHHTELMEQGELSRDLLFCRLASLSSSYQKCARLLRRNRIFRANAFLNDLKSSGTWQHFTSKMGVRTSKNEARDLQRDPLEHRGRLLSFLLPFLMVLGRLLGSILASFWHNFRNEFSTSFLGRVFLPFWAPFWTHFGLIFGDFLV